LALEWAWALWAR